MVKDARQIILLVLPVLAISATVLAQGQPPRPSAPPAPQQAPRVLSSGPDAPQSSSQRLTPLRLQVVISKYEGTGSNARRISSMPYELAMTANDQRVVNVKMGAQVPVPSGEEGGFTYLNVGTTIDAIAHSTEDGRFMVEVTVEDTAIIDRRSPESQSTTVPTLRTFHANNSVLLRDGQSSQFTAAIDQSSGEVVKVEVMLAIDK